VKSYAGCYCTCPTHAGCLFGRSVMFHQAAARKQKDSTCRRYASTGSAVPGGLLARARLTAQRNTRVQSQTRSTSALTLVDARFIGHSPFERRGAMITRRCWELPQVEAAIIEMSPRNNDRVPLFLRSCLHGMLAPGTTLFASRRERERESSDSIDFLLSLLFVYRKSGVQADVNTLLHK